MTDQTTIPQINETVAFADLYVSPLNPRTVVSEDEITSLAENIKIAGLIHNLAGFRHDGTGGVGVVAGGRRYPTPPKSSCIGCPFHKDTFWRDMQLNDPASFADAVAADKALRKNGPARGMRSQEYMHRSCQPLGEIDFEARTGGPQIDFMDECSGTCGT